MVDIRTRLATAALTLIVLAACAPAPSATGGGDASTSPGVNGADAAERTRLEALYRARQDSARMRYTEADVAFMTGMIAHHAQALIMSRLAPERDASPAIRTLAARIINAQEGEIRQMQQWLGDRGEPVPEIHIDGLDLTVHGAGHEMRDPSMPGMLTDEQLAELAAARGARFDRLFLTFMIGHHQGAVVMVRQLFARDGAGQDEAAFKLATDINVDQRTEIARMQSMLADLSRQGTP